MDIGLKKAEFLFMAFWYVYVNNYETGGHIMRWLYFHTLTVANNYFLWRCTNTFVTGFVERGLLHTSNSYPFIHLCWCFLLTKYQVSSNLKLWIIKVGKLDVCGRPLYVNPVTFVTKFRKIRHIWHLKYFINK